MWIKLKVGMFDGDSFHRIRAAQNGSKAFRDKLTAVWFELIDLAGRGNCGGVFVNSRGEPYSSISDIAAMIDRKPKELAACMEFFIADGMITAENDVYSLTHWSDYQNAAELDRLREQNRIRQANYRARKKDDEPQRGIIPEEPKPKKKSDKPEKHKHGKFKRVLLTDEEADKLTEDFGKEMAEKAIAYLDAYIEEKGYKAQSHNLSIRRWVLDAVKKQDAKAQPQQPATSRYKSALQPSGAFSESEMNAIREMQAYLSSNQYEGVAANG